MTNNTAEISIQDMLDAGVHYGHKQAFWNPKMSPFIYAEKNGLHIINLQKTAMLLIHALQHVANLIASKPNAKILFVATKRQAAEHVKESAQKCGQYFVHHRWLGGMLTNWKTVSNSLSKLEVLEKTLKEASEGEEQRYNKKELLNIDRKRAKLEDAIGGIRGLNGKPDVLFVIDTNKEKIAIKEAKVLNIPVIAIVDTNSDPDDIDFPIPGNDDASKAISYYCNKFSEIILRTKAAMPSVELNDTQFSKQTKVRKFSKAEQTVAELSSAASEEQEQIDGSNTPVDDASDAKSCDLAHVQKDEDKQ